MLTFWPSPPLSHACTHTQHCSFMLRSLPLSLYTAHPGVWVKSSLSPEVMAYCFRSLRSTYWLYRDDCRYLGRGSGRTSVQIFCFAVNRLTEWQTKHYLEHHSEGNIQCAKLFLRSVITHPSNTKVYDMWWCPQWGYFTLFDSLIVEWYWL